MANSIVNASLTLTIQDQTVISGSAGQVIVNRIVPTFSFASAEAAQYSGFQALPAGNSITLTPSQVTVYIAFVRVVSGAGLIVQYSPGPGFATLQQSLGLNGVLLICNPPLNQNNSTNNWIVNVVATAPNDGVPIVFEYLFAW